MAVQRQLVGGSFAPALTLDKVPGYRKIAEQADPKIKDAMLKLCQMAEVFHETSESTLPGEMHITGLAAMTPLEQTEIDRIWDHVPWDHECDMLGNLFDTVQAAETRRNSDKIEAWQRQVHTYIIEKYFQDDLEYANVVKLAKEYERWEPYLKDEFKAEIQEDMQNIQKVIAEVTKAWSTKGCEDVPYPALEPTPIRDAAGHLLWMARELEQDREPLTRDRVGI